MATIQHPPLAQVGKLINLIPVGLKEAALDSPTFRATTLHFSDQVDLVERWLDDYLRSTTRLTAEIPTLESLVNNFLSHATLPTTVSEAIVDHDYSLLAMKRYADSGKDFWMSTLALLRRLNTLVAEPIRAFISNDLRTFKEVRRVFDANQRQYDSLLARYSAQAKSKEPSALREDAFQLHEARKAYIKSSMDFCVSAPHLRTTLDKLMVRIFFDQWREMRVSREHGATSVARGTQDLERIKGWTHEMENSEKAFRRELYAARKQLEETAESTARPSRELDDYSVSTTPYLGATNIGLNSPKKGGLDKFEKQGWLFLRTFTGKPLRTVWVRRWAFVKNGIFGWLIQGSRSGGVEESERIGVLLCNVRPASQEERRFCFEIKTKNVTMMVQAETQVDLAEWLTVFESAKKRALDDPTSTDALLPGKTSPTTDPAFSISPPPVPEFAATFTETLNPTGNEESSSFDRTSTLPIPGNDLAKESFDVPSRRSTAVEREEGTRDHAARIISKLDLHRKSTAGSSLTGSPSTPTTGGIASLIAASHGSMPVGPGVPVKISDSTDLQHKKANFTLALRDMPSNSLAPSTLANPPAPTSLSKAAVIVSGERGIGVGTTGGMPGGMLANLWGTSNWGFVNRLERGELKSQESKGPEQPASFAAPEIPSKSRVMSLIKESPSGTMEPASVSDTDLPKVRHRQTISLDGDAAKLQRTIIAPQEFPNYYPLQLKTQDAQFRLLFPNVRREEKLVLVFRATWNPNDEQEFPGRAYVTTNDIYFYSNHLGLVLTTGVTLKSIAEVTAAPGRDCDFLFLHFKEAKDGPATRITIKTFLESLKLLQKRLNFLVRNSDADEPMNLEEVIKTLIKMEQEGPKSSPSLESWENVSPNTPMEEDASFSQVRSLRTPTDLKAPIRVDRTLDSHGGRSGQGKDVTKFKLPSQPVEYVPSGNMQLAAEKKFDISPKALFHVLFGDKSAVWQLLHHERQAHNIKQSPWTSVDQGHFRRDFNYNIEALGMFGGKEMVHVHDYQVVDVLNDHLCYVVTDKRTAWYLPYKRYFRLVSKLVITHVAKSKSKLAIFTKVEWLHEPLFLRRVITSRAMSELSLTSLDIVDLVTDQVRRLGPYSRTRKAIQIFGTIGQSTSTMQFSAADSVNHLNLEMRQVPKQQTLALLLFQIWASLAQSAVTSLIMWSAGAVKWTWKTVSANTLILTMLGLSIAANTYYSSRDGLDWWHERNAANFMRRVGIQPNMVMSKSLYTHEIDGLVSSNFSDGATFNIDAVDTNGGNLCFATFFEETAHLGTQDIPSEAFAPSSGQSSPSLTGSSALALRVQRTRQRLGSYRHDLLVAMRVINSIERELLKGEWERWVREEVRRCGLVRHLVEDAERDGNSTESNVDVRELSGRYLEYCGSCESATKQSFGDA